MGAVVGLHHCTRLSSAAASRPALHCAVSGLHTAAAPLAAEHGLRVSWAPAAAERVLSGCGLWALECWVGRGAWAQLLQGCGIVPD